MNLDELHPGRELDALIHEKVMGLTYCKGCHDPNCQGLAAVPKYSTRLPDGARLVHAHIHDEMPPDIRLNYLREIEPFTLVNADEWGNHWPGKLVGHEGDISFGVCRAALKVAGIAQ